LQKDPARVAVQELRINKTPGMSEHMNRRFRKTAFIVLGCALIVLTRLPQFLGNMFFPDGDECIVGLMAKHLLDGKDFSFFLYGQSYALSVFEIMPAALFFKVFGLSATGLKAAALCLWTAGWIFFVLFLWRVAHRRMAMIGGILLIFLPAWNAVSLKAWGTHVTAFAATSVSLWVLAGIYVSYEERKKTNLLLGCCLAVVALANPVWFFAFIPFIGLLFYKRRKISDVVFMAAGAMGLTVIVFLAQKAGAGISSYWTPPVFTNWNLLENIGLLPERIWVVMTGSYFLNHQLPVGPATVAATGMWLLLALLFLTGLIGALIRKKSIDFISRGFSGVILFVLILSLLFNNKLFGYRYLLPLTGAVIVLVAAGIDRLWSRGGSATIVAQIVFILLILTGTASLIEFRHVSSSGLPPLPQKGEPQALADLSAGLLNRNIRHVYSMDAMLQWQIMFASREEIKARWLNPSDRYPEYPRAVDRAFASGDPVALVGRPEQMKLPAAFFIGREKLFSRAENIDGWYVAVYDPGRVLLEKQGFILNQ